MRVPLLPVMLLLLAGVLIDCYIYLRMRHAGTGRRWCWLYMVISAAVSVGLTVVAFLPKKDAGDTALAGLMWTLFIYLSVYIPKLLLSLFMAVQQLLGRLTHRRLRGIAIAGGLASAGLFGLLWWGALYNRFEIEVREVSVPVAGLPGGYDGYRIAQISDLHTGTFGSDTHFVERLVKAVNDQHPDIIVFTGDIVNRHSAELIPFIDDLSRLSAPDGVWSIMGNHDYGDYYSWPAPSARHDDIARLQSMQRSMGWNMLNNSHTVLHRGNNDSIVIIGVENIGDPPFTVYGDLSKAYASTADKSVKILLSHNPAHWDSEVAGNPSVNIALTLSGHTHAMQCKLMGLSPAAFRYDKWGGLYTDSLGRHLYVNIGVGEVGMPARIGATPEITLITLKPAI